MPDLNALLIFAQMVEANSFSKAARRLEMPTSTVSRRITELEEALGQDLFSVAGMPVHRPQLAPPYLNGGVEV
jgi:DNA-binding transcriptional LysR family regulator